MSEPREWWLDLAMQYGDPCDFVSDEPHKYPSATNIHVIEKSAYDKLKAERDRLKSMLRRMLNLGILTTDPDASDFAALKELVPDIRAALEVKS